MKKKYAIVNDNRVVLTNKPPHSRWRRCLENPKIKIKNNLLHISGEEIIYNSRKKNRGIFE